MTRPSRDRWAGLGLASVGAIPLLAFAWLLWDVFRDGLGQWSWAYFLAPVSQAGREGGIGPVLVSTAGLVLVALAFAVPVGLGTAWVLAELLPRDSKLARGLRGSLEVLAAVPSIVFGLFGMTFFSQTLKLGWSIASGGLTLGCMALPIFTRVAEESLSAVPNEFRYAGRALGIGRVRLALSVLLPEAMPGLFAGMVLGLGRALAETAAVMFTAGASVHLPRGVMDPGRSLAYHVYIMAIEVPGGGQRAASAAAVLIVLIAALSAGTRWALMRWAATGGGRSWSR